MSEFERRPETPQQRRRHALFGSPGGGAPDERGAIATIASGPYAESLPVAGMTVAQVRERFAARFDIDPASQATIEGADVRDDTVIRAGQVLAFGRRAGEKGALT